MCPSAGLPSPPRGRGGLRVRSVPAPKGPLSVRSLPVTIKYGLPFALLAGLIFLGVRWGIRSWNSSHAWLTVVDQAGNPVGKGTVDFFPYDSSRSAPSPMPIVTTIELSGPKVMTLGWEQVPGEAVVRVRAPGYGVGFGFLESGGDIGSVLVGPPVTIEGRVLDAERQPVSDAVIVGMGGGPRGVPLAETVSGVDGTFRLEGLSASLATVTLRVLHEGYAVLHETVWRNGDEDRDLRLQTTAPVSGSVTGLSGIDPSTLRILAYNVPGVSADVGPDGSFRLDFLPPEAEVLLLVHGLPRGYTHRGTRASAGSEGVSIQITRAAQLVGRVIMAETEGPAAGAIVYHENGPSGRQTAEADASGRFTLDGLPAGEVWIHASARSREVVQVGGARDTRVIELSGRRSVEVEDGENLTGVEIRVY